MYILQLIYNFFFRLLFSEIEKEKRRKEEEEKRDEETEIEKAEEEERKIRAKRLAEALDYAVKLPYYQRGYEKWSDGTPKTFCNVLARKFLLGNFDYGLYDIYKDSGYTWLNYDIQQVFTDMSVTSALFGVNTTGAYRLAKNAVEENRVKQLTPEEAQEKANNGTPIWGVYPGHEVIVYPDDNDYDSNLGPKVAQAGGVNFSGKYISHKYCWGEKWKDLDILFIQFPMREDSAQMPFKQ
jgi:hypothetical protein